MEFLAILIILIMLCMILNISTFRIIIGLIALLVLIALGMMLIFAYYFIRLFRTRLCKATFTRIDNSDTLPFRTAYYLIDGAEYPCVFPAEGILQKKLYHKEKICHVLFHPKMKQVYDRYALASCVLGTLLSIGTIYATLVMVQDLWP